MAARQATRTIRIWCAAASTGQEPYSLAMCLKERAHELAGWRVDIVATDISGDVVARARQGRYSHFEAQRGLPIQFLIRYFSQVGEEWQIAPELRDMVRFRQLNLLADFSALGVFDLVFCRNVLIYFDQDTKADVLNRIGRRMAHDGFLVLGAAETALGLTNRFKLASGLRGSMSRLCRMRRRLRRGSSRSMAGASEGRYRAGHRRSKNPASKNPGRRAGVCIRGNGIVPGRDQAGILASSSDGSRST